MVAGDGNVPLIGPSDMTRLLTVDEVAERLGVTKDWVWAQARAGRIPHVQPPKTELSAKAIRRLVDDRSG